MGMLGHDQRQQWERLKRRVTQFADVEVVIRRVPRKLKPGSTKGIEGGTLAPEVCFCFAARDHDHTAAPPPLLLCLDRTPVQQFFAAVEGAGAAGILNPELRKVRRITA